MKKRLIKLFSSLLILVLAIGMMPVAFAATAPDADAVQQEQEPVQDAAPAEPEEPADPEEPEVPQDTSKLYVSGVPVASDSYQNVNGTNYITVRAFMAIVDPSAAVSEENGTVRVTAAGLSLTAVAGEESIQAGGSAISVAGGSRDVNGLVALPVRVLASVFNMDVYYDGAADVAYITPRADASVSDVLGTEPADESADPDEEPAAPAEPEQSDDAGESEEPAEPVEPQYTSKLYVDGTAVADDGYQNVNGTNYITVQAFMGIVAPDAAVTEKNGTVSVEASDGDAALSMTASAGVTYIQANDRCLYVSGATRYVNGLVAVPVRVMATVFNMDVSYDASEDVAFLTAQEGAAPYLTDGGSYYNSDSLYWLSHIINAESGNQPLNGKIAVGNVIMNRVNDKSSNWPNTIQGVIFQKNQFSPAASGSVYRTPNAQSVIAAKLVLEGVQVLPGAKFFNATYLRNTWAARNRPYLCTIGGHAFYA